MASTTRDEISRLELLHAAHPDGLVFPHLADAYRRAGRFDQADEVLKRGLQRHSDYAAGHVVLGRLRLDQARHAAAAAAFRRVLDLEPENHMALEYLGRISLEQGRLEDALTRFRRLARLRPTDDLRQRVAELERRVETRGRATTPVRNAGDQRPPAQPSEAARPNSGRPPSAPAQDPEADTGGLEPSEVMTETMAELYTRQSLHSRAAGLYRRLLERNPGDARLRAKLDAAEAAAVEAGATEATPPTEVEGPAGGRLHTPELPSDDARSGTPPEKPRPDDAPSGTSEESEPDDAPSGTSGESEPDETSAGSIRARLRDVLAWRPSAAERPEPWPPLATAEERADERPTPAPASRAPERPAPARTERAAGTPRPTGPAEGAKSAIAVTEMLVSLLEFRDPALRGRSSLVRRLVERLGRELGLRQADQATLALAALLRDVGRVAVQPASGEEGGQQGRDRRERRLGRTLELLDGTGVQAAVRRAVRHRHERWDGKGYPDGLAGREIPRLSRLLAVAESFAERMSAAPGRSVPPVKDAVRDMLEGSGIRYDPAVVRALVRLLDRRDEPLRFVDRRRVLVVGSDRADTVLTATRLGSAGYLTEVAQDPSEAGRRLADRPVAILVSGLDRKALARLVKAVKADRRCDPAILVVEAHPAAFRVWLLEHGADVCLAPGATYGEIAGTLAALVRRAESRTAEA